MDCPTITTDNARELRKLLESRNISTTEFLEWFAIERQRVIIDNIIDSTSGYDQLKVAERMLTNLLLDQSERLGLESNNQLSLKKKFESLDEQQKSEIDRAVFHRIPITDAMRDALAVKTTNQ